jgi:class 3 adenylate cyclase/CHAT domain-containing protein/Tfp pilus assembly protein PilF
LAATTPPAVAESTASGVRPIEELLRERLRLDERLQQEFRREITLLFSDIQDSTAYFERHSDLDGRQMLQRHNDLLFPLISSHQGTVLKTVRDTIMASFAEPPAAVQAAIAMQRALRDHNRGRELAQQIRVRIGINSGQALVETQDVFGDVVNVAARVEACALPEQILISNHTYERLPASIPCRLLGAAEVQGKVTPVELYEVHWDERKTFQETVLLRGPGVMARPTKIFALEVSQEGERLKLSAHERWPGEERPVRHYEYLPVSLVDVQHDIDAMVALLHRITDRRGTLEPAVWQEVKATGAALYNRLLTPAIQDKLRASTATDLFLYIDDTLVQIPWELLYDGQTFLCRRFSMGRLVSTQQTLVERQERRPEQALKMLIIADPQGDLAAATREGKTIQDELASESQRLHVDVRQRRVSTAVVKSALSQHDVLHYAGHADYDLQEPAQSGWRLADGKLTAHDVMQLGAAATMPALVFCNACQSGQTQPWTISQEAEQGIYGLANAFLLAGVQHYIGSFWEIPDQPSSTFAIAFYRALAQGIGVGEALRRARQALAERYGEESVVWASYVLYGDPTSRYLDVSETEALLDDESVAVDTAVRGESRVPGKRPARWLLGAGALGLLVLLAALVIFQPWPGTAPQVSPLTLAYQALEQGDWPRAENLFQQLSDDSAKPQQSQAYAGLAALALARGDSQQALDLAAKAEAVDPDIAYSHVIRGNVLWNQGKSTEAAAEYRLATQKPHSRPWQQAMAYSRLGRLHAAQGEPQQALEQYDKALHQRQDIAVIYADKAYVLAQQGQHEEALALYRQALRLNPDDPLTSTLLDELQRRQQVARDDDKQQRLDQLVTELVQTHQQGLQRPDQGDGWTSMPLTLAFLDVQARGTLAPRAGEEEFLRLRLTQALQADNRLLLLEREVLEKLLTELKLSTTVLVDPQVALHLGRLLAARLIATASITRLGDTAQLTMRVIETETSRIRATATEGVESAGQLDEAVQRAARTLLPALRQAYPLQGRIAHVTPQGIVLNIGIDQGMVPGLILQVFGTEEPLTVDGKVVGYHRSPVGRVEVTSVEVGLAQARILEQTETLQPGWKVQEGKGE